MVDKRMGKVEGVVSSKMLFRERRFFLTGTNINYDEARQIIKDGTLTPGPIRVTLCGTLKTYEGEKFLQDSVGDRFQLKGVSATQWEEMEKLPKVKVEGVLDETNTNLVEVTQINP
jgi:hypothetical protein